MRGTVAATLGAAALGTIVVLLLALPDRLLGPDRGEPILPDRWLAALLVAGVGALVMTRRLMHRDGASVV